MRSLYRYSEVPVERDGAGLGQWLTRQKQKHRDGLLPDKAARRLVAMGVEGFEVGSSSSVSVVADPAAALETALETEAKPKGTKSKSTKSKSKSKSKTATTSTMPEGLEAEAAAAMAVAGAMMRNGVAAPTAGAGALEAATMGGSGFLTEWEGLDRSAVEMVQSLRAFLAREGAGRQRGPLEVGWRV